MRATGYTDCLALDDYAFVQWPGQYDVFRLVLAFATMAAFVMSSA